MADNYYNFEELIDIFRLADLLGFKNPSNSIYLNNIDFVRDDLQISISSGYPPKKISINKETKFTSQNIPDEMRDIRKKGNYSINSSLHKGDSFEDDVINYSYKELLFKKEFKTHDELMSIIREYFLDEIRERKLDLLEV